MNIKLILAPVLFALSFASTAADYEAKTGYIEQIDVAAGNNLGFRVLLKGVDFECGNKDTRQAYLNDTDSNYETFTSVLLAAKMSKTKVRIYTVAGVSQNCRIHYVIMLDE